MNSELQQAVHQFQESVSLTGVEHALNLAINLLIGGVLAMYVRWLYARYGASASDAQAITRVFPLLTLVTTAVITVVKSSLALSLGLVGALSIVRFRAAIKEPEELVYLFMCIAVGLSLGAGQPLLAVALVLVASVFVVSMHYLGGPGGSPRTMLTITGDSDRYFQKEEGGVLSAVSALTNQYAIQRLDIVDGQGQVRIILPRSRSQTIDRLVNDLRQRLPDCEFSFINLDSAI